MKITTLKLLSVALTIFIFVIFISNYTFIGGHHGQKIDKVDPSIQWEFFEKQLLAPEQAKLAYGTGDQISFPHNFSEHYGSPEMYGTYVAKLKLPKNANNENIAIYIPFEYGSYKLYIDDQLLAKNGEIGMTKEQQVPESAPKIGQIHNNSEEVYVTLQLSNFYSIRGGFSVPLYIGPFSKLVNEHNSAIIFHFFINGIIFIASIFSTLVGCFNRRDKRMILFAMFCFVISVRAVFARPFLYSITVFNISWEIGVKIEAICSVLAFSIALTLLAKFILQTTYNRIYKLAQTLLMIQLAFVLFSEPLIFQQISLYTLPLSLVLLLVIIVKSLLTAQSITFESAVHYIGSLVIFLAAIHDLFAVRFGWQIALILQHSQVIYVVLVCFAISWKYAQKQKDEQRLKDEILQLNASLDLKIKERTAQLEKANETLQQLATKDALTGIDNRYSFDHHLEVYFEHAKQKQKYLSLLLLDLDYFKKYNDHYGHVLGDALLQQVVKIIDDILPEEAIFARYGGEEFAIIYPNANEQQLEQLGHMIVKSVASKRIEHILHPNHYATISAGGFTMSKQHPVQTKKQLLAKSDERLYEAKHKGRNQYVGTHNELMPF